MVADVKLKKERRALVADFIEELTQEETDDTVKCLLLKMEQKGTVGRGLLPEGPILQRKFGNMLAAFRGVMYLEKISSAIEDMGTRHLQRYGVPESAFDVFGGVLIDSFEEVLGDRFTSQLREAWTAVYDEVAAVMKRAYKEPQEEEEKKKGFERPPCNPKLLGQIGGFEAMMRIHKTFYDVLFVDPWLGRFFAATYKEHLIEKQTEFMVTAFGGAEIYKALTPALIHMHMYLTQEILEYRAKLLREAILEEGLSEEIAEQWLEVDRWYWPTMAKSSVNDCVLPHMGQSAIVVKKPEGFL